MELNNYIDHTNLKKDALVGDIQKLCEEAISYHFASVCVYPYYVKAVSEFLQGTNVETCTVIGFPNGQSTTNTKVYEAIDAVENGATEIDMMINISALKNQEYDYVKNEIEEIRDSVAGKTLKVIIETCLLTDEEIVKMTEICNDTFVNFIKTSTGFDKEGATIHAVELINANKGEVLEIKASGGIRDLETTEAMIRAGATRIGTSCGLEIMQADEDSVDGFNSDNEEKCDCDENHECHHEHDENHKCKCKEEK